MLLNGKSHQHRCFNFQVLSSTQLRPHYLQNLQMMYDYRRVGKRHCSKQTRDSSHRRWRLHQQTQAGFGSFPSRHPDIQSPHLVGRLLNQLAKLALHICKCRQHMRMVPSPIVTWSQWLEWPGMYFPAVLEKLSDESASCHLQAHVYTLMTVVIQEIICTLINIVGRTAVHLWA